MRVPIENMSWRNRIQGDLIAREEWQLYQHDHIAIQSLYDADPTPLAAQTLLRNEVPYRFPGVPVGCSSSRTNGFGKRRDMVTAWKVSTMSGS